MINKKTIFVVAMTSINIYTYLYMSGSTTALAELMPMGDAVRNVRSGVSVMLVLSGEAQITIDGGVYPLLQGSIVVLFPFHTIAWQWKSADFLFEYLYFDFDFMADFPLMLSPNNSEQFGANPYFQTDETSFADMTQCYEILLKYYEMQEHPSRIEIIKAQLFTFVCNLLYRCAKSAKTVRVSREEVLTDGFFKLLHNYHTTERTLTFYANQLCITTKYLSKVVSRTTEHTVYFWIEEFTTKQAKLLLRSTDLTVTEIAEQLNFANSSFFAKFFRRHTGHSPVQFRRRGADFARGFRPEP